MTRDLTTPEGLVLRAWTEADAPVLLAAFGSSPELARQAGRQVSGPDDAREWVRRRAALRAEDAAYFFAVTDGAGGALLGNVAVGSVDRAHDSGWVSYWTVEPARGRGVAAAGVRRLTDFCFGELGLHRLELGHRTNNPASCRVALRAGFASEGIERGKLRYGDERYDVERHSRLSTDPVNQG
ncbi:GNAT family N-acetyltransferase [Streptomyces sp. NPDC051561]|uniref:GNAT family N-acetyltransferase n=1 Tax=Streptomyces sp. NPDC051561 TaxID=3365658 RepID=UPI0037A18EAC